MRVMLIRRFLRFTEMLRLYEGAYPKERIPDEVKLVYDPSMGISDGVASGAEDSDKWDSCCSSTTKSRGMPRDARHAQECRSQSDGSLM